MLLIFFNVILISFLAGYLGTVIFSKKMTLAVDALGHLTLPGIALALIYDFNIFFGALPFVLLGIFLIWFLENKTKLSLEFLTAVVFSSFVGIAFLFLPLEEAEEALIGNVLKIDFNDTILNIFLSVFIFVIIFKIYRDLILMNISEDFLKIESKKPEIYNFLYLLCFAIFVSFGVKIMGGLLITSLIALPIATARNLSFSLKSFQFFAIFFALIGSIIGLIIFILTDLPLSPLIILTNFVIFLISIILKNIKK